MLDARTHYLTIRELNTLSHMYMHMYMCMCTCMYMYTRHVNSASPSAFAGTSRARPGLVFVRKEASRSRPDTRAMACTDAEKDHLNALHQNDDETAPTIILEYGAYMN